MATILDTVGNTPIVELKRLNKNPAVKIYGKLEGDNPGGSVKDRAAYGMIKGALDRGEIKARDKLVEATSGNTGIALAMIARIMGLNMTLVMPDNSTRERVLAMEAYGAKVILTPHEKTIEYSRELAEEMSAKEGYHILNQFANKSCCMWVVFIDDISNLLIVQLHNVSYIFKSCIVSKSLFQKYE